jgi:RNA polymerase-binding transcription factor DksA
LVEGFMQTRPNTTMLRRLEQMRATHVRELEERRQALRDALADPDGGFRAEAEGGFARDARGLGAGLLSISAQTVQLIEDALRRLRAGSYGRCVDCESPIAPARLRALPFAETCVRCQESRDETTGVFPAWAA